ncbi:TetR family transcriptional regulator C-terminal domain-containing protein [Actinoplanes teichomyceticus]|uniref:TetR family transcriptional regulator C-terminal domain-containing protein n=1 Tax=Actinoplanes teichomyceticus TaxID=1867 RepID=UPI0021CC6AB4|nr:TetR family transcriptional regulator C-terminal domain-containing protein [Actinoplanes teichomyceticus]
MLADWLPLDEQRRREAVLRHTLTAAARTRSGLRPHARALRESMSAVVHRVLTEARAAGGLAAGLDIDLETARLYALLDGLSLRAVAGEPDSPRAVLRHHLDTLP